MVWNGMKGGICIQGPEGANESNGEGGIACGMTDLWHMIPALWLGRDEFKRMHLSDCFCCAGIT